MCALTSVVSWSGGLESFVSSVSALIEEAIDVDTDAFVAGVALGDADEAVEGGMLEAADLAPDDVTRDASEAAKSDTLDGTRETADEAATGDTLGVVNEAAGEAVGGDVRCGAGCGLETLAEDVLIRVLLVVMIAPLCLSRTSIQALPPGRGAMRSQSAENRSASGVVTAYLLRSVRVHGI
jgi:hypothetical protein